MSVIDPATGRRRSSRIARKKRQIISDSQSSEQYEPVTADDIANLFGKKLSKPKALWPVYLMLFAGCVCLFMVSPVRVQTVLGLGGNATMMGTRCAFTGITNLIISASIGLVLDTLGRKPTMLLITIFMSLGWFVCSQTDDLMTFMALSSVTWSYYNTMKIIAKYMITDCVEDPAERSQKSSMVEVTLTLAMMLGPLMGGILSTHHNVYRLSSMIAGCVIVLMVLIVPETKPTVVGSSATSENRDVASTPSVDNLENSSGCCQMFMLTAITVCTFVPLTVLIGCMNTFAVTVLNADSATVGKTMMSCTGMATLTQLILPSLTKNVSGKTRIIVAMLLTCGALHGSTMMQDNYMMWVVCMMAGWIFTAQGRNGVEDVIQQTMPGGKGHSFMAVVASITQMSMGVINGYLMDNGFSVWKFGTGFSFCAALFTLLYTTPKGKED